MTNPHELPVPNDILSQGEAFVRDLAYGVVSGSWDSTHFLYRPVLGDWSITGVSYEKRGQFEDFVNTKWDNPPHPSLLISFGFLVPAGEYSEEYERFLLTENAFSLLSKPLHQPDIFISYRRKESSAFALLLEARLKIAGNPNPFVDKNIMGGEDWHGVLKERVEQSAWFISLVGATTLDSDWVRREIEWANNASLKIVTVCHNGKSLADCPSELTRLQGYEILEETALQYEAAVNFVLNSLGYTTY